MEGWRGTKSDQVCCLAQSLAVVTWNNVFALYISTELTLPSLAWAPLSHRQSAGLGLVTCHRRERRTNSSTTITFKGRECLHRRKSLKCICEHFLNLRIMKYYFGLVPQKSECCFLSPWVLSRVTLVWCRVWQKARGLVRPWLAGTDSGSAVITSERRQQWQWNHKHHCWIIYTRLPLSNYILAQL